MNSVVLMYPQSIMRAIYSLYVSGFTSSSSVNLEHMNSRKSAESDYIAHIGLYFMSALLIGVTSMCGEFVFVT